MISTHAELDRSTRYRLSLERRLSHLRTRIAALTTEAAKIAARSPAAAAILSDDRRELEIEAGFILWALDRAGPAAAP